MKAREIMTRDVRTVGPDTTVTEIAKILLEQRISGVPVVEDGLIIGIVSEGDLIHRREIGADRRGGSWWLKLFKGEHSTVDFIKIHGLTARDVMTRPAVTVGEETPLNEIADLFEARQIKRVPVEKDGRLVGIVCRANFLQALADSVAANPAAAEDQAILVELLKSLKPEPWWHPHTSHLMVSEGVVHVWGLDGAVDERDAIRIAALNVAGVREVEDHRIEPRSVMYAE